MSKDVEAKRWLQDSEASARTKRSYFVVHSSMDLQVTPYRFLVIAALLGTGTPFQPGYSQSAKAERLRGIDSVQVVIEDLDETARDVGLSVQFVRTKVELELRKAGIRVYEAKGGPYLYVNVNVIGTTKQKPSLAFAFNVDVQMNRMVLFAEELGSVLVDRGPPERIKEAVTVLDVVDLVARTRHATVWSASMIGVAPRDRAQDSLTSAIVELLEQFMNDYLSVHPAR